MDDNYVRIQEEHKKQEEKRRTEMTQIIRTLLTSNNIPFEAKDALGWTVVKHPDYPDEGVRIQLTCKGYSRNVSQITVELTDWSARHRFKSVSYPYDGEYNFNKVKFIERVRAGLEAIKKEQIANELSRKAHNETERLYQAKNAELEAKGIKNEFNLAHHLTRTADLNETEGLYRGEIHFTDLTIAEIQWLQGMIADYQTKRAAKPNG